MKIPYTELWQVRRLQLTPRKSPLIGDDRYGKCYDKVFILSCDLIRNYLKVPPKWNNCVWTLTPRYIKDSGYGDFVRKVYSSGLLDNDYAYYSFLKKLGYEVSDEERSMMSGTHDLFGGENDEDVDETVEAEIIRKRDFKFEKSDIEHAE